MAKLSGWAQQIMQDIDLPDGMIESSSGNDVAPSVMTKPTDGGWYVQLFVDDKDPALREDEDHLRFAVFARNDKTDADGWPTLYADQYDRPSSLDNIFYDGPYTTESYADALTAVLGLQYALTVREWLINNKADCTAHANQYSEMCALYFDQQTSLMEKPTATWNNIAADYCDDNQAMIDAFAAVHGPLPDDRRIVDEAHAEMDKAYKFAVGHVFLPAGNGDAEQED